jgi:hypothetical protein
MFIFDRKEDKILYDDIKAHLKNFHYADIHGELNFFRIFTEELIDGEDLDIPPPVDFEKFYNYIMLMLYLN